jgi:hypothetical protein
MNLYYSFFYQIELILSLYYIIVYDIVDCICGLWISYVINVCKCVLCVVIALQDIAHSQLII